MRDRRGDRDNDEHGDDQVQHEAVQQPGAGGDPYANLTDTEAVEVLGVYWVFRQITGAEQKRIQNRCRNRRGDLDQVRFFNELCDAVVAGQAMLDDDGAPMDPPVAMPGTRFSPSKVIARVANAMEDALMTFLFG